MGLNLEQIVFFDNNNSSTDKKIIFFGAGTIVKKFLNNYDKSNILFLVDNNKKLWGSKYEGIKVYNPNKLREITQKNVVLVIMTTSFIEVIKQIKSLNKNLRVTVSHYLKDLINIEHLQYLKKKILISSGLPANKNNQGGGGLYEIKLDGQSWKIKKVYSGTVHGVIKYKDGFAISDSINSIILLDKNYKIKQKGSYPINTRAHGIAFDKINQNFYIACSNTDQIKVFDINLKLIKTISISNKFEKYNSPQHHINDIFITNENLYVCMFSLSGNNKNNIYDGGVYEIDLTNNKNIKTIYGNLFMPHSIKFIDGTFMILDSLRGDLVVGSQKIASFPGFSRGLSKDKNFYYIGQSRNRNYSIINQNKNNVSIDNSVLIYDPVNKFSRNLYLPNTISEIHEVLAL